MKRAVISDIHGNLEALEAVLADAASIGVEEYYCLGDIVGYGPNPRECVDRIMGFKVSVLGNHDQGALFDPEGFSSSAERAIFWTREQLEDASQNGDQAKRRWEFLAELPRVFRDGKYLYVHGSARSPLSEYVFPEDVYHTKKLERIFGLIEAFAFQGHTHVPGVFTEDGHFFAPSDLPPNFRLGPGKAMINVGSVGQPRDGDPRACYCIQSDDCIEFRRVSYAWESTANKIFNIPSLDDFLGERLRDGR